MTQEELYEKYPHLFARKDLPRHETCMCWGIAVGKGWLSLIDVISADLSKNFPDVQYEQIKEKFGSLRIYTKGTTDETKASVRFIIERGEYESQSICEECGAPGKMRSGGWLKIKCDEHNEDNSPTRDTRTRWIPDNHPNELNGILLGNLGDGHLANIIRYMEATDGYTEFHIYLYEIEAATRGLTAKFLQTIHPFTDEYEVIDGECVLKQ